MVSPHPVLFLYHCTKLISIFFISVLVILVLQLKLNTNLKVYAAHVNYFKLFFVFLILSLKIEVALI